MEDACYQRVAKLGKKPKPNSESASDINYYKYKECGNPMEKNHSSVKNVDFP